MNHITILVLEPKKDPYPMDIPNNLSAMQRLVGGYIEAITQPDGTVIVCNEECKIKQLPPNRWLNQDMIFGTFFICRAKGEEFISLKVPDIEKWSRLWRLR